MDSLSGLYQLLDSRVGTFGRLCRLQGKLNLILAQQNGSVEAEGRVDLATAMNTPLLTVSTGGKALAGCHGNMSVKMNLRFLCTPKSDTM